MFNSRSSKSLAKKALTISVMTSAAAGGLIGVTASPASAATVWCGSWLQNPANASAIKPLAGTFHWLDSGKTTFMRINHGTHDGNTYAWAKLYDSRVYGTGVAMIWRYSKNSSLYQCGNRNGDDPYQYTYCSESPCDAYTAGVRKSQATRVQTKFAFRAQTAPNDFIEYGPAVDY